MSLFNIEIANTILMKRRGTPRLIYYNYLQNLTLTTIYISPIVFTKSQNGSAGLLSPGQVQQQIFSNIRRQSNISIQLLLQLLETTWQFPQRQLHPNGSLVMELIFLRRRGTGSHLKRFDIYFAYGIGVIY
jgi:hypothetical protein